MCPTTRGRPISGRLLYDGVPVEIVGWDTKNGASIVDIVLADGRTKWAYWPSPRFTDEIPQTRWRMNLDKRYPDELRRVPTLQYDCNAQRWELHAHGYYIKIKYAWNGETWCEYRYFVMVNGIEMEAVTSKQYNERRDTIRENEGDESADLWHNGQTQVSIVGDGHHVFSLREQWEAMLALGLFRPMVTHKEWESAPLDVEVVAHMDAARERWQAQQRAEGMVTDA